MGPPLVDSDLWRFGRYLEEANRAHEIGDSIAEVASLRRAVEEWRGEPLVDLAAIDESAGDVEHLRRRFVDASLRLGELFLVAGRFDESLRCAEQSRAASPYSERARRLEIACHLQRHDRLGIESAVRATETMLAELGVEPEGTTKMVLRQAQHLLGSGHRQSPV
jgi:hypothetical protein